MTIARTGISRSRFVTLPLRDRTDTGGTKTKTDDDLSDVDMGGDADPDEDDDTDDGDDDEPEPFVKEDGKPFTKADFDALQDVIKKERAKARAATKAAKTGPADKTDDKTTDPAAQIERAKIDAEAAAAATWKPLVVRGQAASALTAAGLIGKPDRLLKLLDHDEIDVDPETGELDGLDEQIADLKRDYPYLFRRKGSRALDAADRGSRRTDKMTDSQIQAAQLKGEI